MPNNANMGRYDRDHYGRTWSGVVPLQHPAEIVIRAVLFGWALLLTRCSENKIVARPWSAQPICRRLLGGYE
jgi:hypothetical protein